MEGKLGGVVSEPLIELFVSAHRVAQVGHKTIPLLIRWLGIAVLRIHSLTSNIEYK